MQYVLLVPSSKTCLQQEMHNRVHLIYIYIIYIQTNTHTHTGHSQCMHCDLEFGIVWNSGRLLESFKRQAASQVIAIPRFWKRGVLEQRPGESLQHPHGRSIGDPASVSQPS